MGELLDALQLLRQRRAPYAHLLASIVRDTLERHPADPAGPVVEIGAGMGQLSAWLPPDIAARTVYTDPSQAALDAWRAQRADVEAKVASADELPFADQSVAAVLGLCVFDALADETATVREIARVLRPSARFVHFLDMATLLERPFEQVAKSGMVPIPNVFTDPGDHAWPLDIVLLPCDWLVGMLRLARAAGHPLHTGFGALFDLFLTAPFPRDEATKQFKALASSFDRRKALAISLTSAAQVASTYGYPALEALPFHSGRYLLSVLAAAFDEREGFQIELADVVTRSAFERASPGDPIRYRSLCLGHERRFDGPPERLLTEIPREEVEARLGDGEALTEAGMFVFVARRVPVR